MDKLDTLEFYEQLLQQLRGIIVLKDMDNRFVLSNQYTANMFGYEASDSIRGLNGYDLRCPAVECAPEFIRQDDQVLDNQSELTLLEILTFADLEQKIFLSKKKPFVLDMELTGSICHCTEMSLSSLHRISSMLMQSDKQYYPDGKKERTYTINGSKTHDDLTPRELDCLFYMLRGRTMKDTAAILGIGWRCVEDYINNIKFKWNCPNKKTVIEYAITHGYLDYIPQNIVIDNVSYTLSEVSSNHGANDEDEGVLVSSEGEEMVEDGEDT